MRTLAILTNGGDTCSLNAAIKSIRDQAISAGFTRVLGFEEGFRGVIGRQVKLITWQPIDPLQGGTILCSQRYAPVSDEAKHAVFTTLADLEVEVLIVIGGDGSLAAARDLHLWSEATGARTHVLGFPRTIDNDIRTATVDENNVEVALCPGYPSAALKIARFAKDLRTVAMSSRKIFVMETMGRDAGWLAAAASLGGAELILIPEVELASHDWRRLHERVAKLYSLHGHVIVAVSEGFKIDGCQEMDESFGPRKLGGIGIKVAKLIEAASKDQSNAPGVRYQQLGYIPRMGGPSAYDVELASALAAEIGAMLRDGRKGELPVPARVAPIDSIPEQITSIPLTKVGQFFFPATTFYNAEHFCINGPFIKFLQRLGAPASV
jgi:ATP-dependent phosphofructokinase / diphosphate-dependent phosphofructokinase